MNKVYRRNSNRAGDSVCTVQSAIAARPCWWWYYYIQYIVMVGHQAEPTESTPPPPLVSSVCAHHQLVRTVTQRAQPVVWRVYQDIHAFLFRQLCVRVGCR